jgi:hypothetical protein
VVKVVLAERKRFLNTQPAAPEHDDQRPQPEAMAIVAGLAHDRDDLFHGRGSAGQRNPLLRGGRPA